MPRLETRGIHHITMVTTDAVRAVAFYRDLLGLGLVKRTVNFDDPGAYHLYFGQEGGAPGTLLTFFEWPGSPRGRWGVGGVHHLALSVDTPEAQLKWKRRLTDAGIPVTGPLDRGYFTSIYFGDPDGQVLEIATRGPGYAIDEPADALGRTLIQPDDARLPDGRDEAAIAARTWPEAVPAVTDDMRLTGIHHITGITGDLGRMHDFFEEALGLPRVKRTLNQDDARTEHWFWARYDGETVSPRSAYTLFGWPDSNHTARPGAGQTHHVAFRARDDEEQQAWIDHLRSLEIQVTPVQERHYFRSVYFRAPDGMLFEIATDGPGFAIDEPADALGRELRLPPWMDADRAGIAAGLTPIPAEPLTYDGRTGVVGS